MHKSRFIIVTILATVFLIATAGQVAAQFGIIHSGNWWRNTATIDLDFYHNQYYLAGSTCTPCSSVVNFISAAGATFTRASTITTSTSPPFYLNANAGQSFVSRASTGTYFDGTGTLQTAAINVGRAATYSYSGGAWTANSGTLIEPASTNAIRDNTMVGAAAGSPGTTPNYWQTTGNYSGLTQQVIGTGTTNGLPYIDIKLSGTPTATFTWELNFDGSNQIAAARNQTWTMSAFLTLTAGSLANVTPNLGFYSETSGASLLTIYQTSPSIGTGGLSAQRYTYSTTVTDATAAYLVPYISFLVTSGQPVNLTVRIGMPQLEQLPYSTTVIATSSGAVSRSADVYQNLNGGAYFNASGVLVFASANTPRLDHSPVSPFQPMGVLLEDSRTNFLTYSVPDSGTNWTYTANNTVPTINAATALDGTVTATKLADTSTNAAHYTTGPSISFTSGKTYTFSVYVQPATATYIQLVLPSSAFGANIYATFGTVFGLFGNTQSTGAGAFVRTLTNNWNLVGIAATATASASGAVAIALNNSGLAGFEPTYIGSGQYLYVWGAQVEDGGEPTSYIPTSGSSVTRPEDVFIVPGTAGSGWLASSIGTFGTVGIVPFLDAANVQNGFAGIDNSSASQAINTQINPNSRRASVVVNGGVGYSGLVQGLYINGQRTAIVMAYSSSGGGEENGAGDRILFNSSGSAAPPTITQLNLGVARGTTGPLNGWLQRFWYMQTREPDRTLTDYSE